MVPSDRMSVAQNPHNRKMYCFHTSLTVAYTDETHKKQCVKMRIRGASWQKVSGLPALSLTGSLVYQHVFWPGVSVASNLLI